MTSTNNRSSYCRHVLKEERLDICCSPRKIMYLRYSLGAYDYSPSVILGNYTVFRGYVFLDLLQCDRTLQRRRYRKFSKFGNMLFLPIASECLRHNILDLKYFIVSNLSTLLPEDIILTALLSISSSSSSVERTFSALKKVHT
jgi:hypothetical protein